MRGVASPILAARCLLSLFQTIVLVVVEFDWVHRMYLSEVLVVSWDLTIVVGERGR